jgi:membrane protease YdiL (CAAX protease family)
VPSPEKPPRIERSNTQVIALSVAAIAPYVVIALSILEPQWFYSRSMRIAMNTNVFLPPAVGLLLGATLPILYSATFADWEIWSGWGVPRFTRPVWWLLGVMLAIIVVLMRPWGDHFGEMLMHIVHVRFVSSVVISTFIVAVGEEALTRGFLLGAVARRLPFRAANVIQATVFAIAHTARYDGMHISALMSVKIYGLIFVCALIWGALRRASGSLWLPIASHFLFDMF